MENSNNAALSFEHQQKLDAQHEYEEAYKKLNDLLNEYQKDSQNLISKMSEYYVKRQYRIKPKQQS